MPSSRSCLDRWPTQARFWLEWGSEIAGRTFGHFPYGELWYETSTSNLKYATYYRDAESGLDYAMARFYGSTIGRFTTPDPLGGALGSPQSLNRYSYVLGDPVNLGDPTGLDPTVCFWAPGPYVGAPPSFQCSFGNGGGGGGGFVGSPFVFDAGLSSIYAPVPPMGFIAGEESRHLSIITTGYDPALGRYRGVVTVSSAKGVMILKNPTKRELTEAYLKAAGLWEHIDPTSIKPQGDNGLEFRFKNDKDSRKAVAAILGNDKEFLSGRLGHLHGEQVGGEPWIDYRSIRGVFGRLSLQVVLNTDTFWAYADVDRWNPYQGVFDFMMHALTEVLPYFVGGGH